MRDITLPGIHDDEVLSTCSAIDLLKNKDSHYFATFNFLGRTFPLLVLAYHCDATSYFLLPFFVLFGINVFSLRITSIFFGFFTLMFTYLFSRRAFGTSVALIATLLLATSPFFISATRTGPYFHSHASFFVISSIYFLFRWYEQKRTRYFLLGVFLLGVGCSTAGWFAEYLISLLFLAFIFRKDIRKIIQSGKIKPVWLIASGVTSFCLGNFLFIYANFINKSTRFLTFKVVFERLHILSSDGNTQNNLDFIGHLAARFGNLIELLRQNDIINRHFSGASNNNFYPAIFFLIILWLIFLFVFRIVPESKRKWIVFLLLLVCITLVVASFVTLTQFSSWHLLILAPFIQIIVALGLIEFIRFFKNKLLRKISLAIVCLCLLIATILNLSMDRTYLKGLQKTGNNKSWCAAIYDVADWLKKNNPSNVVAFGYAHSLYFLTQGEILADDSNILDNKDRLTRLLNDEGTLYLFDIYRPDLESRVESLRKIANSIKKSFIKEKIFYYRDGSLIEVYSLKPD